MRTFGLVMVGVLLVGTANANAVVLCAKPKKDGTFDTSVLIRESCRGDEQQLDPGVLGLQGPPGPAGSPGECSCTTTTTTTLPSMGHCAFQGRPCTSDPDCALAGSCAPEGDCRQACPGGDRSACSPQMGCFNAAVVGFVCVGCANNSSLCPAQAPCVAPAGGFADDCTMPAHPACPVGGSGGTPCVIPDRCVLP
jgi:hypothetical protein